MSKSRGSNVDRGLIYMAIYKEIVEASKIGKALRVDLNFIERLKCVLSLEISDGYSMIILVRILWGLVSSFHMFEDSNFREDLRSIESQTDHVVEALDYRLHDSEFSNSYSEDEKLREINSLFDFFSKEVNSIRQTALQLL
jgi:hypothetical protein